MDTCPFCGDEVCDPEEDTPDNECVLSGWHCDNCNALICENCRIVSPTGANLCPSCVEKRLTGKPYKTVMRYLKAAQESSMQERAEPIVLRVMNPVDLPLLVDYKWCNETLVNEYKKILSSAKTYKRLKKEV